MTSSSSCSIIRECKDIRHLGDMLVTVRGASSRARRNIIDAYLNGAIDTLERTREIGEPQHENHPSAAARKALAGAVALLLSLGTGAISDEGAEKIGRALIRRMDEVLG